MNIPQKLYAHIYVVVEHHLVVEVLGDRHAQEVDQGVDRREHVQAEADVLEEGEEVAAEEEPDEFSSPKEGGHDEEGEAEDEGEVGEGSEEGLGRG